MTAQAPYLKEWREYRGMSQRRLCDLAKKSPGTISKVESGWPYTQAVLEGYATALNVRVIDLFRRPEDVDNFAKSLYIARHAATETLKCLALARLATAEMTARCQMMVDDIKAMQETLPFVLATLDDLEKGGPYTGDVDHGDDEGHWD